MTDNNDPINTTLRGRKNFKLIQLPWLDKTAPPVRLEILSGYDEMMQLNRAQRWCETPEGGNDQIKDANLIDHAEQCYLLWYALRDPDRIYANTADEHERIYKDAQALQADLDGEQIGWLLAEYSKFRAACSPFRAADDAPGDEAYNDLLAKIREEFSKRAMSVTRYKIWYCVKHGVLPTEERFRDMTHDQWALLLAVTPMSQLAECFPDLGDEELQKYTRTFVDVAGDTDPPDDDPEGDE